MSGYIGTQPVPQSTQHRESFTATSGQTSFATAGYTPQFLDVYLNGIHLVNGDDYTATNGSDVVLTTGAATDDVLEVVSYTPFEVADQTFTGTTTLTGDLQATTATFSGAVTGTSATLSGGVYLGGTGAANLLDDYEEGTWTPSFSWATQSVAPSPATTAFRYVKVGSVVHVMGYAWGNWGTGSGLLVCSNLPFVSGYSYTLVPLWSSNISSPIGGYISGSSSTLNIALLAGSSGNFSSSNISGGSAEIGVQFSYITTA